MIPHDSVILTSLARPRVCITRQATVPRWKSWMMPGRPGSSGRRLQLGSTSSTGSGASAKTVSVSIAEAIKEKGHEIKCDFIGRDGYFETARIAVETAAPLHRNLATDQLNQVCHEAAIAQDRRFASQNMPKRKYQEIENVWINFDYLLSILPLLSSFLS